MSRTPSNNPTPANALGQRVQSQLDTQRSLQAASAALESALDGIQQARNSLLQISESRPSGDVPTASPTTNGADNVNRNPNSDGIGPGHDALLLTGGTATARGGHWTPQGFVRTSPEVSSTSQVPSPFIPLPPLYAVMEPSLLFQTPPLPSVVPPRFSRQVGVTTPTLLPNPNSSATSHGLRVAARLGEANSPTPQTYAHQAVQIDNTPPVGDGLNRVSSGMNATTTTQTPPSAPPVPWLGSRTTGNRDPHPSRSNPVPSFSHPLPSFPSYAFPQRGMENSYPHIPNNPQNLVLPTPDLFHRQGGHMLPVPIPIQMARPMSSQLSRTRMLPTRAVPGAPGMNFFPAMPGPGPGSAPGSGPESNPAAEQPTEGEFDWTGDNFISWLFPAQEYAPSLVSRQDPQNPGTLRITRSTDTPLPPPPSHSERPPRRRGWGMFLLLLLLFSVVQTNIILIFYS